MITGSGAPSGSCTTGDSYIDLTSDNGRPPGEVYSCVFSAWQDSGQSIQGPQGPQGPSGISRGVTTGIVATVPIDSGPNTPVVVLTAPAVASSGTYYITASVTMQVASGDLVACAPVPNQIEPQTAQFGAPSETISNALVVNGALSLSAGQAPSIICIDANSNPSTEFLKGSLNATLIDSSNAAASAVQPRSDGSSLKLVTGVK